MANESTERLPGFSSNPPLLIKRQRFVFLAETRGSPRFLGTIQVTLMAPATAFAFSSARGSRNSEVLEALNSGIEHLSPRPEWSSISRHYLDAAPRRCWPLPGFGFTLFPLINPRRRTQTTPKKPARRRQV